jgi:hypothetical protein
MERELSSSSGSLMDIMDEDGDNSSCGENKDDSDGIISMTGTGLTKK